MKIVATIEARMSSSRLPGKVLLSAGGATMLEHLVYRLRHVPSIDEIVLATTINAGDNVLAEFADKNNIKCFRGSEDDVLDRVIKAAESVSADVIVEITGDCPLIDPELVEQTIRIFRHNNADYVSNGAIRSYPDGMDVQVFALNTLRRSATMTKERLDREHVTRYIIQNPDKFSRINILAPPGLHWPELGLTLDERSDYELIKKIIEYFGDSNRLFSCADILHMLRNVRPEWLALNEKVKRKGLDQ